jgi:AbrB family looped-hinge helix DNA binding protein
MADMLDNATTVDSGGRVVLPARFRKSLGIQPGDRVIVRLEGDHLSIYSRQMARRSAQQRVCELVPENVSLVAELLEDRRRESSRE